MRKIIFILLAFLAVFTYIRVFDGAEASPVEANASAGTILPIDAGEGNNTEISVEIIE